MRGRILLVLLALSFAAIIPTTMGCRSNPVTGAKEFNLISPEQEVQLGKEAEPQVVAELGGTYNDPVILAYVREVGGKVAAQAQGDLPYEYSFGVVNNDQINAFALPGGPVYVTKGLLFALENESQLAGVLAHEVTHVAAQHSATAMSQAMGVEVFLQATLAALGQTQGETTAARAEQVGRLVTGLQQMKYSREHETEADIYGLRFLTAAGYNPNGMLEVMQLFQRMEEGGGGPEFLRTHPNPENRAQYLQQEIQTNYAAAARDPRMVVGRERYQQQVLSRKGMAGQYSR